MRDPYQAHEALVSPARPTATLGRLILGVMLAVVLVFSFGFCISIVLDLILPEAPVEEDSSAFVTGRTPFGVLANLYVFLLVVFALAITIRNVHARSLGSLIGDPSLAFAQFKRVCLYIFGLYVALSLLVPADPDFAPEPNLPLGQWMVLLPLALPALIIQTGAEELLFRGYLQSQLAARFARPGIWIIVPSLIFGLLHYDTAISGDNAWIVVIWATAFGVAAADITARAGTLGPAIALHFMNNSFAILLTAPSGNFDGMALFTYPFSLDDAEAVWQWAPVDLMVLFVSWLTMRLALKR